MKRADLDQYRCPGCQGKLALEKSSPDQSNTIEAGILTCQVCGTRHPIVNAIPRFVPVQNYADSFGIEWKSFPKTQLDDGWQRIYHGRFFQTTNFSQDLRGQTVLEVGCGPGNFTGIILATGARLFSLDLSAAVDVCQENHRTAENQDFLSLCQADLHQLPFA